MYPPPHPLPQLPYGPILALAAAGTAETAYLTLTKLTDAPVACPLSAGCATVLTSSYATLNGWIPLPALGLAAYAAVGAASLGGIAVTRSGGTDRDQAPWRATVLAGALSLASTSAYLLSILATQFQGEQCPWCLGSAALSFGIAGLALGALRRRELEEGAGPGAGIVATTLLILSVGLGNPDVSRAGESVSELPFQVCCELECSRLWLHMRLCANERVRE